VYAWLTLPTSISQNSHTGGVGCRPHITRQYSNNSMVVTYTCEQFVNFVHGMQVHGQLYQLLCSSTGYRGLLLKDSMPWCKPHRKQVVDGKDSKNKSRFRGVHMYVQTNTSYRVGFSFLFVARKVIWMTDPILFILLGMPQSFITIKGDLMGTTGWEHRRSSGGE